MKNLNLYLGPLRLNFLILTPICIAVGIALSLNIADHFFKTNLILCLVTGIFAHLGVNTLNEYFNYKSGLDKETVRTPFSGGSGTLVSKPELSKYTLFFAVISILLTFGIGIYFVVLRGIIFAALLLTGLFLVIMYDILIVKNPILCYLAPGIGFGIAFISGTEFILTGQISSRGLLCSFIGLICVSNILLLNQYPDINADKKVGRRTLPVVIGIKKTNLFYKITLLCLFLSIIIGVTSSILPKNALLILFFIILGIIISIGIKNADQNIKKLEPFLALNIVMNTGVIFSLAVILFFANGLIKHIL